MLAVAASDEADHLASISNYNNWVDICAPGVSILSSIPGRSPQDFGVATGTSMSTPLVSGVAALVKSIHRDWTAAQIRLQIILSADPIEGLNPVHADSVGRGRLNLYRALADEQPGLEMTSCLVEEGASSDHDGVVEPREDVNISFTITNLLTRPATVSGRITSSDPLLNVSHQLEDFGLIAPGASASNDLHPFVCIIDRITLAGHEFKCSLHLEGEGVAAQSIPFSFQAEPELLTHDNGSIAFTVTNFGALGYYNYVDRESVGEGLRYPPKGLPALFHGSVMVGKAPNLVSDCAFGDSNAVRFDFRTTTPDFRLVDHQNGAFSTTASFNDNGSLRPLNISVTQRSVTYNAPPEDDFVLVSYVVHNGGLLPLEGLRLALFLDWDVIQSDQNLCQWDAEERLGWMSHTGSQFPVFGVSLLSAPTDFYVAIDNEDAWPNGIWSRWSDEAKWRLMELGFQQAENLEPGDYSQLVGSAPFALDPGANSPAFGFAILAGDDIADLRQNLTAACTRWNGAAGYERKTGSNGEIRLLSLYPQPFNSRVNLVIENLNAGSLRWRVFDSMGRCVKLGAADAPQSGRLSLPMDFNDYPAGRYLIGVRQENRWLNAPITIVK